LVSAVDGIKMKSRENSKAIIHHADPRETLKIIYDLEEVYMCLPTEPMDYNNEDKNDNEVVLKRIMMAVRGDLRDPCEVPLQH